MFGNFDDVLLYFGNLERPRDVIIDGLGLVDIRGSVLLLIIFVFIIKEQNLLT